MLSKLAACSGFAPSRLRARPVRISVHRVLLWLILRLIEPFGCITRRQELGWTHHAHPVELRRLCSSTPHRPRRILAIRSVQDDVSDLSHRCAEGSCLKGIRRLQGMASASTRCLRSQGSCLRHSSSVFKSKQHGEFCDTPCASTLTEAHLLLTPPHCPFEELDFRELTTAHTSQHLGIELIFHDSIQPIQ